MWSGSGRCESLYNWVNSNNQIGFDVTAQLGHDKVCFNLYFIKGISSFSTFEVVSWQCPIVIGLVLYGSGTPECHAIVIHDTSSHHTIDKQDQPGIVLSINVEC